MSEGKKEQSPAKRGFWLGATISGSVLTVCMLVFLGYAIYDDLTGGTPKTANQPGLAATVIGFVCMFVPVIIMVALSFGAGGALWMTLFSSPLTKTKPPPDSETERPH